MKVKNDRKMGDLEPVGRGSAGNVRKYMAARSPSRMRSSQRDRPQSTEGLDDDSLLQGMWTGPDAINGSIGSLTNP